MGLADFFGGGAKAPKPIDPRALARQTIGVQEEFLPGREKLRSQYNPQIIQGGLAQLGRAQEGLSGVTSDIAGDISRDRASMNQADIGQLRQQSQGFAGAERLQAMLQQQAEDELARGGQLSPEQMRNIDQLTQGATQRQGRGSGAFNVGQLALARHGAVQAREDRARQFAGQTLGTGLATANPFQRIQSQNATMAGGIGSRLQNAQGFAGQNTVNFDPINQNVAQIANQNFQAEQAKFEADRSFLPDLIGGGLSLAGNIFGGPAGGVIAGKLGGLFGGGSSGGGGNPIPQFGAQSPSSGIQRHFKGTFE